MNTPDVFLTPEQIAKKLNDKLAEAPVPPTGIYTSEPADNYHRWNAVSNSRLGVFKRSPAHYRAAIENPTPDTPALILGRAVHSAILEPELFAAEYVRGPEGNRTTKKVKEEWAELEGKFGPGRVLKPVDYDRAEAMARSVHSTAFSKLLLAGDGAREFSVVWDKSVDGVKLNDTATYVEQVRCKARLDRLSFDIAGGAVVDLKTTTDASPKAFERSIYTYGYHRQAAFYIEAARAAHINVEHFVILAVEKTPPYACAAYRVAEPAIDAGADEINALLKRFAECQASNHWPGYSDQVEDIYIPDWAWNQIETGATT